MGKNNMKKNKIFKMYEEASFFFKQGDFEQALTKFSQVISEGGSSADDDMILKVVNAALRQREKCQFRIL